MTIFPNERREAVIIGINDYNDKKSMEDLKGAVNDATELRELLKKHGEFDIKHFLTDKDATAQAIRNSMSDTLWASDPRTFTLFYFAGHAIPDGYGHIYLAPVDFDRKKPFVNGISIKELSRLAFNVVNKDVVTIILDCCYGGALGDETRGPLSVTQALNDCLGDLHNPSHLPEESEPRSKGRYFLASTQDTEPAREEEFEHPEEKTRRFHGVFTYSLLQGLRGEAADDDGTVSLGPLLGYVEESFTGRRQKPVFKTPESRGLNVLTVAVVPYLSDAQRHEILETARACIEAHGDLRRPSNLAIAMKSLTKIRNLESDEEAKSLYDMCLLHLEEAHTVCKAWYKQIQDNDRSIDLETPLWKIWKNIENIMFALDVEQIIKGDDKTRHIFQIFLNATSRNDDIREIVLKLRQFTDSSIPTRSPEKNLVKIQ